MPTFTTSDGCALDYRIDGPADAPRTLVLLHGWSQSRAMFDRAIPGLAQHHRVVSYDHRGHGESGKPARGARIARLAQDLHELLDHLDVASADMAGHSMGASVLWSYIDRHGTGRFDSIMVLDQPSACTVMPWMTVDEGAAAGAILDFAGADGLARALIGPDSETVHRDFLASMVGPDLPADDMDWLFAENRKTPAVFGAKLIIDHVMQDWRDVLGDIDVPTLVVAGEESHVSVASQEWTRDHIPHARLRTFARAEGGSHFPFYENPSVFVAEVVAFLDSLPAPVATVTPAGSV